MSDAVSLPCRHRDPIIRYVSKSAPHGYCPNARAMVLPNSNRTSFDSTESLWPTAAVKSAANDFGLKRTRAHRIEVSVPVMDTIGYELEVALPPVRVKMECSVIDWFVDPLEELGS